MKKITVKFNKDKPQTTTTVFANNNTNENNTTTKKYKAPQKPTTLSSSNVGITSKVSSKATKTKSSDSSGNTRTENPSWKKEVKINIGISSKTKTTTNNTTKQQQQQQTGGKIKKTTTKTTTSKQSNVEKRFTPLFSNLTPSTAYKSVKALKWTKLRILLLLLLFMLFVLQIISTSTADWLIFGDAQTHGLWRICTQIEFDTSASLECSRFSEVPGKCQS